MGLAMTFEISVLLLEELKISNMVRVNILLISISRVRNADLPDYRILSDKFYFHKKKFQV